MGNLFSSSSTDSTQPSAAPVFESQESAPAPAMGGKKGRRKTRRGTKKNKGKGKGRK